MREIKGLAKTVREILKDQRYSIDFYQREYRWQRKQVQELINDVVEQFLESYSDTDQREDVQNYGRYFLGSIILSKRESEMFIVDGQQRLTTLTLLIMFLHHRQADRPDRVKVEDLVFSERYGKRSFNLAVPERAAIMESLFKNAPYDISDATESVQALAARYQDIEELFPMDDIDDKALPFFCDWLIDNVQLVEIITSTDDDAFAIFETMNDRGLSLTPLEMLKSYLLNNIKDITKRNEAAKVWRDHIEELLRLGKDEDSNAVKTWLRARYAQSVRKYIKKPDNQDFERIGTEFHRWVGTHSEKLNLKTSDDFFRFVHQEMSFYTKQYLRLRAASENQMAGLEPVYHVACYDAQSPLYHLMLAPLLISDDPEIIGKKIRLVAIFLDIRLARRAANSLRQTPHSFSYEMFFLMKDIRGLAVKELARKLFETLEENQKFYYNWTADDNQHYSAFARNSWQLRHIKMILARITVYVEQQAGIATSLEKYLAKGKSRYEIEHIWADKPERHTDDFKSPRDFSMYREKIGGMVLLPKSLNASYGKLPYDEKLPHYNSQNLLARSLHPQAYKRNPGFLKFIKQQELPFHAHAEFKKADMDERCHLYRLIADRVWSPHNLLKEIGVEVSK